MIRTKQDLKEFLAAEKPLYLPTKLDVLSGFFLRSRGYMIWKYVENLRKSEYHLASKGLYHDICYAFLHRKWHILGRKLGLEVPPFTCEKGLLIYHCGRVAVNADTRIGENCVIAGSTCVGNTGPNTPSPKLGKNVYLGWNTVLVGGLEIADNVKVGAGAVVIVSVTTPGAFVAGVPATIKGMV